MTALEIAVQGPAGARIALAGGADRVELCTALGATGGLTPSIGAIRAAAATGAAVHPLIRPRPGGFVYSCDEVDVLADLGVDRVLTSGGAATAHAGIETIAALAAAGTGVQIMAGGGVRPGTVPALVAAGADAVHLSARSVVADLGAAGPGGGSGGGLEITDPDLVVAARAALTSAVQ